MGAVASRLANALNDWLDLIDARDSMQEVAIQWSQKRGWIVEIERHNARTICEHSSDYEGDLAKLLVVVRMRLIEPEEK